MSQSSTNSVEVVSKDGSWLVRVREGTAVSEVPYEVEEHARSFAAGQAMRLGIWDAPRVTGGGSEF